MRHIWVGLLFACLLLQYKLWLGDGSVRQLLAAEKKLAVQKEMNDALFANNEALSADIYELKSAEQTLEEQARFDLGMIKDDEVYYHFVD